MDKKNKLGNVKKFCVVEFLELPYRTIEKYVIVPSFWVKKQKTTHQIADVTYPRENPAKTKDRCRRHERPKGNFRKYLARIKFEDDNYASANQWIVQNIDDSTNNGIIESGNGESTNNANRNIEMEHYNVPSRNGLLNTKTEGKQSATTVEKKTQISCYNAKHNENPPVNSPLVGNDRITRMESLPLTSSSSATTHKQLEKARETTPMCEVTIHLSNSFKDMGTENLSLTRGNNLSRGQEIVRRCAIKRQDFSQSNARNTPAVSSTSTHHSHQPVVSQNEELLSTVSDGISHNHCGHQEPVPERSIERNFNNQSIQTSIDQQQRSTIPQNVPKSSPLPSKTQNPLHLMKQRSPIPQIVPKSSPVTINENQARQELRDGKRLNIPTEVNRIGKKAYSQEFTENTPSAVSISSESEHRPRVLYKCSQEQHLAVLKENLPQNSDTLKIGTTGPLELKLVFNDKPHQEINENALFAMQNLSNAANQLSQMIKHCRNQWQPVYKVPIQNDFSVNDMFLLGSTGAGELESDQKVPFQSFTENTEQSIPSTIQYPSSSGAHTLCSSESSQRKRYASFIPSNHFQSIRNYDLHISGSTGENCSKLTVDPLIGINSTGQSKHFRTTTEKSSMANLNSSHVFNVPASGEASHDRIQSNLSTTIEAFKDMHNTFSEQIKTFAEAIKNVTSSEFGINETLSSNPRNVTETLNEHTMGENVVNNYYDVYNDGSHELHKKKSNQKYSVALLPNYNDSIRSKWTLKYQKALPGIIEVLPRSQVYIDAEKFTYCKQSARTYSKLARILLPEIFSEHALRICTLSGKNTTSHNAFNVRPGLDEHAKNVLLTFVEQYGRKNGWVGYDEVQVLKSLRNKLLEIRERRN